MAQFTLPKSPPKMMPAKKVNAILLKQEAEANGEPLKLKGKGPMLLGSNKKPRK